MDFFEEGSMQGLFVKRSSPGLLLRKRNGIREFGPG